MPVFLVEDERVMMRPITSTEELGQLMGSAPIDLDELEVDMLTLDQMPVPIFHHFAPGVYIREMRAPKGSVIIGHKHTVPHLNIVLCGSATMGNGRIISAPAAFTAAPGRKCAVFHEDTSWLNVFATEEQDVGKLEEMFMEKSESALAQEQMRAETITDDVRAAHADFASMMVELGITAELVHEMSQRDEDHTKLPWGVYKFRTAPSPIGGNGVFASADFSEGEVIGPATVMGMRTVLAYGVNHSGRPNAKIVRGPRGINLVAARAIGGNLGGVFGEEITVDYRESRKVILCVEQ